VSLPLLWQYSFSNFNEKARWALDFKQIPQRRDSLLPGGPRAMAFSRGDGTLPVLDLDGERVVDSGGRRRASPGARARGLLDEHAGHDMRRVGFWEPRDEWAYGAEFISTDQGRFTRLGINAAIPLVFPVAWRWMSRRYDFNKEAAERSRATVVAALDRIESERGGGEFLVGDRFTVADKPPRRSLPARLAAAVPLRAPRAAAVGVPGFRSGAPRGRLGSATPTGATAAGRPRWPIKRIGRRP
jgi:glutathione S-transferase